MKKVFNYLIPTVLLVPMMASAQTFNELDMFMLDATLFINGTLIPILLALAFLLFIWGVVQFFFLSADGDNSEAKKNGKQLMIWGVIAFVVIVSIWGIVMLIAGGLDLNDETLNVIPGAPLSN